MRVVPLVDLFEDTVAPNRYFYVTDAQFSARAILRDNGQLMERIDYDAYGNGLHLWSSDVDADGDIDIADKDAIEAASGVIGSANYKAECDINRDGSIDTFDVLAWQNEAVRVLPLGPMTGISDPSNFAPDNIIGFTGQVFNLIGDGLELYLYRNRWYEPEAGRFIERDPPGYVDGMNLYQYVCSNPWSYSDPLGWCSNCPNGGSDDGTMIGNAAKWWWKWAGAAVNGPRAAFRKPPPPPPTAIQQNAAFNRLPESGARTGGDLTKLSEALERNGPVRQAVYAEGMEQAADMSKDLVYTTATGGIAGLGIKTAASGTARVVSSGRGAGRGIIGWAKGLFGSGKKSRLDQGPQGV